MKKKGNCMPSKEIKEKLKKLNMKTQLKEKFLVTIFFETVKPSLSEKFIARDGISLSENGEIVKTEIETEIFNNFFGNIVKNPTLKATLKCGNCLSILAIKTKYNRNGAF